MFSIRQLVLLCAFALLTVIPSVALADDGSSDQGGFVLRVRGDFVLPAGDELQTLIVIDGDARIDGTVHRFVLAVNGKLTVNGRVDGDVQVVRGDLVLGPTSSVENVQLVRSDLFREPGSTVTGDIDRTSGFFLRAGWVVLFGFLMFLGVGLALMVLAVGFSLIAGRQLRAAAESLTGKPWQTIVSGIVTVIALPLIAAIAIASIIGVWIGLSILLVLLPVLGLLGLVVSATWLGLMVLGQRNRAEKSARPVGAAALGMALFLVIFLIPGVNVAAAAVFSVWGLGTLVYMVVSGFSRAASAPGLPPGQPPGA
jgi:hypothetical protein